jgi:Ca-activated chloride channel family protein
MVLKSMMPLWTHPWLLLVLLAIPPVLAWQLFRRRRTYRLPAASVLSGLVARRAWLARWCGVLLRGLGLALLVIAAAGPRWPDLRTRLDTEGIAIVMLVDVSGSMAEPDFDWNGQPITRLEAVKRAFGLFVKGSAAGDAPAGFEGRPTDLIGMVVFATRPETSCPLTLSHSALFRLLEREEPRSIPGESETNISDAVALGLYRLQSAGARRKVLVLLSDGEHNVTQPQSGWTPGQAAGVAASLGVPIYTIDAGGGPAGSLREGAGNTSATRAQVGAETLQELARITGGRSFPARDTTALLEACQAIDRLERTPFSSYQYRRYHEGYPWFGLAGFACWALVLGLEMTVWRRLP